MKLQYFSTLEGDDLPRRYDFLMWLPRAPCYCMVLLYFVIIAHVDTETVSTTETKS